LSLIVIFLVKSFLPFIFTVFCPIYTSPSAAGGMKGAPVLDELHAKPTEAAVKPATTTANRRLLKEKCIEYLE